MSNQDNNRVSGGPEGASPSPAGATEPISKGKRNVLKAGWVVPVIAVLSLPKNSYAVASS